MDQLRAIGVLLALVLGLPLILWGCSRSSGESLVESCMGCHNASQANDYAGPGIENPHPFPGAGFIACTGCHGGNPSGEDALTSHVPPPPEIGDEANLLADPEAYFNRLTLAGIDKFPAYVVDGVTWTGLDYLQFVNPGDLRVVSQGRSCGACHQGHAQCMNSSPLVTEMGIFSAASFTWGAEAEVPESVGLYQDTASDKGFRAVTDTNFNPATAGVGEVARLIEQPVYSVRGATGANQIFQNPAYDAPGLANDVLPNGQVVTNSPLSHLLQEQIAFTCGDCHLGSAGANNRYADFRSSGCTACHMPYSLDGKSRSQDPNVDKNEPVDPDDIDPPERSHVRAHLIVSTARVDSTGQTVQGIDDHTCVGCHQGSNRTVLQYWGIRLDQNQDLTHHQQYPANPVSFVDTRDDERLFDPVVDNNTFNGRNFRQYILEEAYDGDDRDDTPADVHYDAGMGCIDCHGSFDLHGGNVAAADPKIVSRMEQAVAIECENCHGSGGSYAATVQAVAYDGVVRNVAVDGAGNPLPHVVREGTEYFLYSKLTGDRHYVPQTLDTIVDNGRVNPLDGQPVYSVKASYAMGRADGISANGIGPLQDGAPPTGYAHADNVSCVACHASWQNTCIGCHLKGDYNNGQNFSNITGERIVYRQTNADFTYQSPVPFQLGVNADDRIAPIAANTEMFYQWRDRNGTFSKVFHFADRNGGGDETTIANPSLAHNLIMPHSIRGKVDAQNEGPRYCVACHLTTDGLDDFGTQYNALRTALSGETAQSHAGLNFNLLRDHIGRNPGNQLNSPLWVHMVAGLGSGLFLFNDEGGPVNPLDQNDNRVGSNGISPADAFDLNDVALNLDRIVREDGTPTGSNSHPTTDQTLGASNRDGALQAGPLSAALIQRLTNPNPSIGIVLDSWLDADGDPGGQASDFVGP